MRYTIPKFGDIYTDTIMTYGIAKLLESLHSEISVEIRDVITHYELVTESPITVDPDLQITPMFELLIRNSTKRDKSKDREGVIYLDELKKLKKQKEDGNDDIEIHPSYSDFWSIALTKGTGKTDGMIFEGVYEHQEEVKETIQEYLDKFKRGKLPELLESISQPALKCFGKCTHLQVTDPEKSMGVWNKYGGDTNRKATNNFWEWMKWIGLVNYVKTLSEKEFITFYTIVPHSITLDQLQNIFEDLRAEPLLQKTYGKRRECVIFNTMLKSLISHHPMLENADEDDLLPEVRLCDMVNSMYFVTFMDFGRTRGIFHFHSLQVPSYISIGTRKDAYEWKMALNDMGYLIARINEKKDTLQLIMKYKEFISSGQLSDFLDFCSLHARLKIHHPELRGIKKHTLDTFITSMDVKHMQNITQKNGFKAIAKAIKNATVNGQYFKSKGNWIWDIHYTLASDLYQSSNRKETFVAELMDFIQSYNREIARNIEKGKITDSKKRRAGISEDDLNEIVEIIENYDTKMVCNLLLAYGTAKKPKKETNESDEQDDQ